MKRGYKKTILFTTITLIVFGILVGLWFMAEADIRKAKANAGKKIPSTPSMTIKGFRLEQTSGDKIEWVLNSKYANLFSAPNDHIVFEGVNALVYELKDQDYFYTVNSLTGTYWTKEDKMNLDGNVIVSTTNGYSFHTDNALYDVGKKKISTDSVVSAKGTTDGGDKLYVEGKGLKGDIALGDFYLIGNVLGKVGTKLDVKSKKAMFATKKGNVLFDGGISAKKDRLDILGSKMAFAYNKKGEMNDMNVEGDVSIDMDGKKALCDHALIKSDSDKVILTGRPEFHSGSDIIVGEKIVFFTDSDEVFVTKVKAAVSEKGVRKKK